MNRIFKTTKLFYARYFYNRSLHGLPPQIDKIYEDQGDKPYVYNKSLPNSGYWGDSMSSLVNDRNRRDLALLETDPDKFKKTVYVSKACVIPRDIVRMNYTIVKNKAKADIVLMPQSNDDMGNIYNDTVVATMDNGENCKVTLWKDCNSPDGDSSRLTELVPVIKTWLQRYFECLCTDIEYWKSAPLCKVKRCDEYQDILDDEKAFTMQECTYKALYIKEYSLPIEKVSNPLSGEALAMMTRQTDTKILEKLVTGSDWSKYPYTMYKFLDLNLYNRLRSSLSRSTLGILDSLKERYRVNRYGNKGAIVSPEDFNMYQDFCLAIMGINGDKGLGPINRYTDYDRLFSNMPAKIAMMKVVADKPVEL